MQIVGQIGTPGGKPAFGVMTQDQAVAWLQGKDPRVPNQRITTSMKTCVSHVVSDNGAAGGGNLRYAFDGLPMRHTSANVGPNQGVTLFYVGRPGRVAKIIGIGYHVGAQTYSVIWRDHNWRTLGGASMLTLDR